MLTGIVLSGCYTTLYPPMSTEIQNAQDIPDSARQVIINNYYETTEYYQTPNYQRYSLLWGGNYWDPFYYDYSYYNWRPYYWYGSYYFYNPHNNYWYYYDRHDHHRRPGTRPVDQTGNTPGNASNNGERIHKPGYTKLMTSPTESAPFIAVQNDDKRLQNVGKVGLDYNTTTKRDGIYSPRLESVGKTSVGSNKSYKSSSNSSGETYKPARTLTSSKKSSSTSSSSSYKPKSSSSSNSSSSNKSSKSSHTTSTSSKNSNTSSSSSSSKKSK